MNRTAPRWSRAVNVAAGRIAALMGVSESAAIHVIVAPGQSLSMAEKGLI